MLNETQDYQIIKILNNNVILALEKESHQEMILVSKGIGFGKKENMVIHLTDEKIEKKFLAFDEKMKKEYFQLMNQIDGKVIGVSEEIIAKAEEALGKLNPHIHIVLTDHIGFALERMQMGMEINNPFLYEIKMLYEEEFAMGQIAAALIHKNLNIDICEGEIGFIALHLHSARQNKNISETMKNTRLLKELIEIIQTEITIPIGEHGLTYMRLMNHLKGMITRLEEGKFIENPFLKDLKKQFKESFKFAQKLGRYIQESKGAALPESELGYMAIHIERIKGTKIK
ncbi:PRD domain-containing protein [Anaerosolibacter sp.]|uniref:PRD domain-containing protein n=1 Tax=Anaerosolibacter sp. TaxID=1872527 RepID=UPI0039EF13D2